MFLKDHVALKTVVMPAQNSASHHMDRKCSQVTSVILNCNNISIFNLEGLQLVY